ncbi:MAG: hypothetical protein PUC12_03810 [Clostridiales bacterium]|nr:hypothetical protein [Clostridiales bacterium]
MSKLQFNQNKILKLQNALIGKINLEDEEMDFNIFIEKMQSYIKVKGATQIGPLIQHTKPFVNDEEELDMEINMLLQCNNYVYSVEKPYVMESVVRVPNCMYCRYIGPEEKLKFAYDKINLEAFENDIELTGESYTIFVDQNVEEGTIVADVFMPKADEE